MPIFRLVSFTGDQRFDLPEGRPLVVGRSATCDIAIPDPTISRRHAELTATIGGVLVKDLGSSNGTAINGTRVTTGRLTLNDSVTFGKVLYQLEMTDGGIAMPPAAPPPPDGTIVRELPVSGVRPALPDRGPPLSSMAEDSRAARKLALLLDVSQKLSGEFDLDRLLGTVADVTFEIMSVDRVSILLRNETTGELIPKVTRSRFGEGGFHHVPRSIAAKVVEERVAVLSDNAVADARFKGQSIMMQSVRSAMCSPLMASADRVLGLLYVDNLSDVNSFSDEDLNFLVAFSGIAAVAIKNSHYADQLQREAMVRSNFERYFAPNVAAAIVGENAAIRPGGDKRPITILFSDIRGFTSMSETMSPDAIADLLTEYFTEMVDIVFEHGGTLDKFMGDAIMALWGAPIPHADDPDRAVRAAVAMQQALVALNTKWERAGRPAIGVGIGVNYGEVFAGNIGSHRRLEYTVIGDAVNVASRLCAEASAGEILLSEPLVQALTDGMPVESLPPMALKGKTVPVPVYRVKV